MQTLLFEQTVVPKSKGGNNKEEQNKTNRESHDTLRGIITHV